MGPHQPSLQNLELLRTPDIASMGVGAFALEKGKDASINKDVSVRGSTLSPPNGATFSDYLKNAVIAELQAAGKYEPSSSLLISGWLTDSQLDGSGASTGSGSLGARFVLSRAGVVVYERNHQAQAQWQSSFVGAMAIPAAMNEYTALYKKLLGLLFGDKEFRAAAASK